MNARTSPADRQLVEQFQGEMEDMSDGCRQVLSAPRKTPVDSATVESHAVTEIEDDLVDETGQSAVRAKASTRPAWARFMQQEGHDSAIGKTRIDTRRERRFKTSDLDLKPGTRLCQLCYTVVVLEPEYIETTATHTYCRCPHCKNSFPIRHDDIEASR
jgi:hypothetical protein